MKDIEIKDKKDFLIFFNIFKKTKKLKSELNITYSDFNFINFINQDNSYNLDLKNHCCFSISILFFFILFNSKFNNIILNFLSYFPFPKFIFAFTFLAAFIYSSLYTLSSLEILSKKLLLKYYSFKYKYDKNKPNFIHFFNEIYYLSLKNKEKNYDLNDIILKFNQEELEILKEHNISMFDEDKIYTNLIHFLDNNIIKEQKLNHNEFKEHIDYLLKNISSEKDLSEIIDQLKEIDYSINHNFINNSTLIHNF